MLVNTSWASSQRPLIGMALGTCGFAVEREIAVWGNPCMPVTDNLNDRLEVLSAKDNKLSLWFNFTFQWVIQQIANMEGRINRVYILEIDKVWFMKILYLIKI